MGQAKSLMEIKIYDHNYRVERIIPKGTILSIGKIMGDAVYVYIGVASDPVLLSKEDLEILS